MVLIIGISVSRELVAFTLHKLNTLFPKRARARSRPVCAREHTHTPARLSRICLPLLPLNIPNVAILHFLPRFFLLFLSSTYNWSKKIINASLAHHSPPLSLPLPLPLLYLYLSPPGGLSPIRTNDEGPRRFCKKAQAGGRAPVLLCATHDQ